MCLYTRDLHGPFCLRDKDLFPRPSVLAMLERYRDRCHMRLCDRSSMYLVLSETVNDEPQFRDVPKMLALQRMVAAAMELPPAHDSAIIHWYQTSASRLDSMLTITACLVYLSEQ